MKKIIFFLIAGGIGFVVDAGILYLLLGLGIDPFTARIFAIAAAMASTFLINRTLTFGASGRSLASEGARYGSVGIASALLNYLVYSGALLIIPSLTPFLALCAGSAAATAFSYTGYSRFVFRKLS